MIKQNLRYILLFIFCALIQSLIFDQIYISSLVTVQIYVLFILLLPIEINKYINLLLAFLLGLVVDIFNSTQGVHASSLVLMAYLRPYVLNLFAPRDDYEVAKAPSVGNYGFSWFIKYAFFLILIHHLFLFYIEVFSFSNFFLTLIRVIISSVISLIFVTLAHFLFVRE